MIQESVLFWNLRLQKLWQFQKNDQQLFLLFRRANCSQKFWSQLNSFLLTQPQTVDALLKDRLQAFLQPITDSDLVSIE